MANIAVIGAGVVGLSTAINVKKLLPDARVTVIADKFNADTTSYGAGGLFRPTTQHIPGVSKDLLRKWVTDSWKWFSDLTLTELAAQTGNQLVAGYFFSNNVLFDQIFGEFVYTYSKMTNEELRALKMDQKYKHGYHVTTVITCCKIYLPWLLNRWLESGGIIENRTVNNLDELVGQYDVVVNCAGLRSRTLVNDKAMFPIRGHLIRVKADWIKCWMYTEDGAYIIPNGDIITIGGTRQKDDYNLKAEEEDRKGIMERCVNLWPPLKDCTVVGEWVGLRPSRIPLRLEPELVKLEKGTLKVVHNYGHGANGISLSWGTSIHTANLVKEMLSKSHARL